MREERLSQKNVGQGFREHAAHGFHENLEQMGKDALHMGNQVYKKAKESYSELHDQVQEHTDHLLENVQKHPLQAVAIAAGIGYLLALILKK